MLERTTKTINIESQSLDILLDEIKKIIVREQEQSYYFKYMTVYTDIEEQHISLFPKPDLYQVNIEFIKYG